jgi:predicted ATPase
VAGQIADHIFRIGERAGSGPSQMWAYTIRSITRFHRGTDFAAVRDDLECAISLHDEREHKTLLQDPGVLALNYAALATWQLGLADQARERAQAAIDLAQRLGKAFEIAGARALAGILSVYRREPERTLENAGPLVQLCTEHQFMPPLAHALGQRGWALAMLRRPEEGIAQIREGLATAQAGGMQITCGFYLGLLVDALASAGAVAEAATTLEDALGMLPEVDLDRPQLLLLHADLLDRQGEGGGVEAAYRDAIALARRQGARVYELRATTRLGRWLQARGRAGEVRGLLEPLYTSFTEGLDTPDLRQAKILIAELE